jgi:hypothetical protein
MLSPSAHLGAAVTTVCMEGVATESLVCRAIFSYAVPILVLRSALYAGRE